MSVINDMLRDLDKRQAPEVSGVQQTPQESLIEPQTAAYKKWLSALVVLLLIAGLIYFFLFHAQKERPFYDEVADQETVEADKDVVIVEPYRESDADAKVVNDKVVDAKAVVIDQPKAKTVEAEISLNQLVNAEQVSVNSTPLPVNKPVVIEKPSVIVVQKQQTEGLRSTELGSKELRSLQTQTRDTQSIAPPIEPKPVEHNLKRIEMETLEKVHIEPKENTMKVKLSPVALDQQMAERAAKLIAQRQEIDAYRELYQFIGEHEHDMESRAVLASYLLQENRIAEAGDILINAPISQSPKLRQIKARWYAAQGQHKSAIYVLSLDLPNIEEYPDYYVLLAAYYQRYGSALDASKTYAQLVDYNEEVADWWAGLGLAADRNNEQEKAIFAYRQALDLNGLAPELLNFVKPRLQQLLDSLPTSNK